jgi:DNA replication and repair protein RecF
LGGNGAGKTSLLEAIYLAATTKSFRTSDLGVCARHDEPGFHVALEAGPSGRDRLELGWQRGARIRLVNGSETPIGEHVAVQPVVLWTAAEEDPLAGVPALARRLVDRGLVSTRPGALAALGRYRHVLAQKRSLLATGGDAASLASWNELLAEAAAEIIALRAAYVTALDAALARVRERTPLELPPLALEYAPSPGSADRAEILAALEATAARERARARPLVGPHRDTVRFRWRERAVVDVASAGERKALGLLLAAAQGTLVETTGKAPLYLLDDADAELDRERLAGVWQAFGPVAQLLATSSRPEVWEGLETAHRWRVAEGRVYAP